MRQALLAAALLLGLGCCVASAASGAEEEDLATSDLQATEGEAEPELKRYYEADSEYPTTYQRRRSSGYFRPYQAEPELKRYYEADSEYPTIYRRLRSSDYFRLQRRNRSSSAFRRHLGRLLRQLLADKDSASASTSETNIRRTSAKRGRGRRLFRRLHSLARLLDGLTRETATCKLGDRLGKSLTKWAGRLKPFLNSTLIHRPLRATVASATSVATADGEEFY